MIPLAIFHLLFGLSVIDAALLHRRIPQENSFPHALRRDTQKEYIGARSPQGPNSNPGEFIGPELSRANTRNHISSSSTRAGPTTTAANFVEAAADRPGVSIGASAAASGSADALPTGPAAPGADVEYPPANNGAAAVSKMPPAAVASTVAEMDAMVREMMNTTIMTAGGSNITFPRHNGTFQSQSWNGTYYSNSTDKYNSSALADDVVFVDAVYPNGTEVVKIVGLNGTGNWTYAQWTYSNKTQNRGPTAAGYAVLPGQTGSGPERLMARPGFTGPKIKREERSGRRWLSGLF